MGLDSIELLLDIEKYFSINIPDKEAEKLYTIQDMVDCVSKHLNVTNDSIELREKTIAKIQAAFIELKLTNNIVQPNDIVCNYIPIKDKEGWKAFINKIAIDTPIIETTRKPTNKFLNSITNIFHSEPLYNASEITVQQLADAICINNFSTLINKENITNTYEVYIAVAGVTVDKIGVDVYEIAPEKSFTNDLGVD